MWFLSFVPDAVLLYVVNAILAIGAISFFIVFFAINKLLRWFPAIAPYYLLLQIISTVVLVAGIYWKGGYGVEAEWRDKVRVAEERARIAEEQAKEANTKIQTKIVEKVKVVKENTVVYRDRIKEVEKLIDKECKVAPEAVDIHNAAAKNKKLGETK
jgi:uncharacterized membrane protein